MNIRRFLILSFLLAVSFSVFSQESPFFSGILTGEDFEVRIVNEGQHDYKPGHGNLPTLKRNGFEMVFDIDSSAWYDPTKAGPLGTDGKDWNKLGGVSFINPFSPRTWKKNSNSALIAWRPSEQRGYYEVCAYTNDARGGWETSESITVAFGKGGAASCTVTRTEAKYFLQGKVFVHKIKRSRISIPVGPWFGGNRRSPQRHSMRTVFKLK